jgi:hypothetical protein
MERQSGLPPFDSRVCIQMEPRDSRSTYSHKIRYFIDIFIYIYIYIYIWLTLRKMTAFLQDFSARILFFATRKHGVAEV